MFRTLFVNGQVLSCGRNQYGQLGVGDRVDKDVPWPLAFGPYSATVPESQTLAALSGK
jgi:alpha-tubulin suppressor-like RCC1 family protein